MNAEIIEKVIEKLIGPIRPVADSSIDRQRAENLSLFIEVFDKMHTKLDGIAWDERNSPYGSVKDIVKTINDYLSTINEDEKLEKSTEHNAKVVTDFIEEIKDKTGYIVPDNVFESFFNA